jgi:DinB superfamily
MRPSAYQQPGKVLQTRGDAVERLKELLGTVVAKLASKPEAEMALPRAEGEWSCKQILGHLIDSAANNHHRFVRAQIEGALQMKGYAQMDWVAAQHYQDRKWTELVLLWSAYNRHLLHLMETVPEGALQNACKIAGDTDGSLEFLIVDYVAHLEHHLRQIVREP